MDSTSRLSHFCASVILCLVATVVPLAAPVDAAPAGDPASWSTAVIELPNEALAYDPVRDVVLVAVTQSVPVLGNHLVEMDPRTGALGRKVFVGSRPVDIAVADDGSRAYVGLRGAAQVVEVDLDQFAVSRRFPLGSSTLGPFYAERILVQPGSPEVIAVVRRNLGFSPAHEGVALYENGVRRAATTRGHTGAHRLTWSDDPGVLYGFNNLSTGFRFYVLHADEQGIEIVSNHQLISGFGTDIAFGAGLVHATNGQVIDVELLTLAGSYTASGHLAVDELNDKVHFLSGGTLSRHDIESQAMDWSLTVPNIGPRQLVDAGDVLAAAGSSSILLVGPGVTGTQPTLPAAPDTVVQAWAASSVPLATSAVAAHPAGSHVYATVGSGGASHANSVVEVDVATGTVTRSVEVGADPHRVAVNSDGSMLIVGHNSATRLTEIDIEAFTVQRTVQLGDNSFANSIAPVPGAPERYAVQHIRKGVSPSHNGVVLVDDGTILPDKLPGHTGPTFITFAGDPARLYGHNGGTTQYGFYTIEVTDQGLTTLSTHSRVLAGFGLSLAHSEGLIYASNGGVVEPTTATAVGLFSANGLPVPAPDHDRMLFVSGTTVSEHDFEQLWPVQSHSLPGGNAIAAVLVGSTVAVATGTQLTLVPLGPDTRTPPGPPLDVAATAADGQLTASWTPPTDDGGAPVTAYTASVDPSGETCVTSSTSCVVSGLTNGTAYTVTVTATNLKGAGPASAASDPVVPTGPPSAPLDVAAEVGPGSVTLSWQPPLSDGGAPVTGYTVSSPDDPGITCATVALTCTVDGLRDGLAHEFEVGAVNTAGPGPLASIVATPTACGDVPVAGPFSDVPSHHRFCDAIEWLAAHEIAGGFPDGSFRPLGGATRQAIAAFFYRVSGTPSFTQPAFPSFADVDPGHPFSTEIEWLAASGLATGFADGTFRPSAPVTRLSLAALVYRFAGSPAFTPPATPTFSDVPIGHPFYLEIEWLAHAGITTGYPDGTFRPSSAITRQAIAATFQRSAEVLGFAS